MVESDTEGFLVKEKDGKESAEYMNASQKTIATLSNSFMRGLVVLFDQVEGEGSNRKAIVVLGWSKKLVQAASDVEGVMKRNSSTESESEMRRNKEKESEKSEVMKPARPTETRVGNVEDF